MPYRSTLSSSLSLCAALALLLPCPSPAQAQGTAGEVTLSDESVQLRYLMSNAQTYGAGNELGFGIFLNENRDIILSSHFFVAADRVRFDRLTFRAGPVGYGALLSTENTDIFSVALAAEARFELLRRQALFLVARFAYAPDILTFGSADNLTDFTGLAELPLTDRVTGFAGYRMLELDLLEGEREVEESLVLGIRYRF